jgi:hypothetical protein
VTPLGSVRGNSEEKSVGFNSTQEHCLELCQQRRKNWRVSKQKIKTFTLTNEFFRGEFYLGINKTLNNMHFTKVEGLLQDSQGSATDSCLVIGHSNLYPPNLSCVIDFNTVLSTAMSSKCYFLYRLSNETFVRIFHLRAFRLPLILHSPWFCHPSV